MIKGATKGEFPCEESAKIPLNNKKKITKALSRSFTSATEVGL